MTGFSQWTLSTPGGKVFKRSQDLDNLIQPCRDALDEGWPVFLRFAMQPDNSIEFRRTNGETSFVPGIYANKEWVERTIKEFRL